MSILAAYTCTPLVRLSLASLKPGSKVKGTTIAELGAASRPIDLMVYTKDGQDYLLLSTSHRGLMKLPAAGLDQYEAITSPTDISGVPYQAIAEMTGVEQLKAFDSRRALTLIRAANGELNLKTIELP